MIPEDDVLMPEDDVLMTPIDQDDDLSMAPALTMAELQETMDGASDAEALAGLAMLQMVVDHPEEAHSSPELAELSKSHFNWIKKSAQSLAEQMAEQDEEGADLVQEQYGRRRRGGGWLKKTWGRAKRHVRKTYRRAKRHARKTYRHVKRHARRAVKVMKKGYQHAKKFAKRIAKHLKAKAKKACRRVIHVAAKKIINKLLKHAFKMCFKLCGKAALKALPMGGPKVAVVIKAGCNVGCNWAVKETNKALAKKTGWGELELLQAPEEVTDLVQDQFFGRHASRFLRRHGRRHAR